MSVKIYHELEQGTPEWHEARRGIITASEIGKLLTKKRGRAAENQEVKSLIYKKAAQRTTGYEDVFRRTFEMERGHDDEAEARDIYAENVHPVTEVGFITREFSGVTLGYSPDGLVGDAGLIEVKSRCQKLHMKDVTSLEMPDEFKAQVQAGMMVSERSWCDFISFPACGGGKMMVLRVKADPTYQATLLEAALAAEAQINEMVVAYQAALASGSARFFETERREYGSPEDVEFS